MRNNGAGREGRAERDARMVERHLNGETLTAIGEDYGLTRERVRQIVRQAGVPVSHTAAVVREQSRGPRVPRLEGECETCGAPVTFLASSPRRFCSQPCVHEAMREHTDDSLLIWLQDLAVRLGHTPTRAEINAEPDTPWHMTFVRNFGSIAEAQEAAGLSPNGVGQPHPHPIPEWLDDTA